MYKFQDSVISRENLIRLQENITILSRIPVFIMNPNADFLIEPLYISEPCEMILDTDKGVALCREEFLKLIAKVKQSKEPLLSSCSGGFCNFAIPIIDKEKLLAVFIGCQIRISEDIQEGQDKFISLADQLEIKDRARFLDAVNDLPVIPLLQLKKVVETITSMLNTFISEERELMNLTKEIVNNYTEISFFYEIGEIFSKGLNIEKASQIILERILKLIDAERISLMLIDKETNELKIISAKGLPEEVIKNTRIKVGEGISGLVAKEGKPILVENIEDNSKVKNLAIGQGQFKTQSFLSAPLICTPLKIENKIIGVINLTDKKTGKVFTRHDLDLLSAIATQIAAVIENRRLFNDIRELFITTVRALSLALDAKDHYTYGHSQRVTECALVIATELNLSDEEKADIELAGLLHDVGKIGIPEGILLKPDKLTNEEYSEVKKHPLRAVEILGDVKQLSNIIPGILYHHERFDGNGYPKGLKNGEIPLAARILAVADAYDAMTSERAYRAALSMETTIEEMRKNAGKQFDPAVTEAFLRAYQKGNI